MAKHELLAVHCADLISLHAPTSGVEFVYASAASRTLLGYDESQLMGLSIFDLVHHDDLIAWQVPALSGVGGPRGVGQLVTGKGDAAPNREESGPGSLADAAIEDAGAAVTMDYRMRRKDGTWIWVETALRPAGSYGYVCVTRDITQRKETETF